VSRTALARAYRPRTFSEVATQEHVSETLRSAVQRGRVAHAYLFCGPRGVGKTTLARVLAMALNCPDRTAEGEPCGVCDSCQRIWAGKTSLDVIEIDAASNRGVDDARDLRERAMYAPSDQERFKVYIIDEAHMLTREAWNALLKILEEPPPRVIFVFATTEPQKIQQQAPPILSRCQRFDFHRIGTDDLIGRMRVVLGAEGVEAPDEVLVPIARKADGGMRDALSLLDQVLSFTEGTPTTADVARVLGLVDDELFLELADVLADRRLPDVFAFVARLLDDGYDLAEFYRGLADFLRALLLVRLSGVEAAELRPDLRAAYEERAGRFPVGDLVRMLAQVAELDADGRFRKSGQQRLLIELLLLRFAYMESTVSVEEVLAALTGGGEGGRGAASRDPAPPPPRPPIVRETPAPATDTPAATPLASTRPSAETAAGPTMKAAGPAPSASDADQPEADVPSALAEPVRPAPAERSPAEGPDPATAKVSPERESSASAAGRAQTVPERESRTSGSSGSGPTAPNVEPGGSEVADGEREPLRERPSEQAAVSATAAPPRADAGSTAPAVPVSAAQLAQAWRSVMESGEGASGGLRMFLRGAALRPGEPGRVQLEVPPGSPARERLHVASVRRGLEEALERRLGHAVTLDVVAPAGDAGAPTAAPRRITAEVAREERLRRLVEQEPLLAEAVKEWDLELVD
jgi:DNA polymerase III subunit gamma/tau